MVRICHRRRMGAQQQARAIWLRIEEERVVHFPRRMASGMLSLVKLRSSVSIRPSATAKPMSEKIAVNSSITLTDRVMRPFPPRSRAPGRDIDGFGFQPHIQPAL